MRLNITLRANIDEDIYLNKLKEEISNSQPKMKSYRENLEHALHEAENSKNDKTLIDQIISNRDSLVSESKKIRAKITAYLTDDARRNIFPKFKQTTKEETKENLFEVKRMLKEIADNLTLSEDDYFLEGSKKDSLVYTYLKNNQTNKFKRFESLENPFTEIPPEKEKCLSEISPEKEKYFTEIPPEKDKYSSEFDQKFGELQKPPENKQDCLHIMNLFENLLDSIDDTDPIKVMSSAANLKSFGENYIPSAMQKNGSLFDISMLINDNIGLKANNKTSLNQTSNSGRKTSSNNTFEVKIKKSTNSTAGLANIQRDSNNTLLKAPVNNTNTNRTASNCTIDNNAYATEVNLHKMLLETKHMKSVLVALYLKRKLDKLQEMKKKQKDKEKRLSPPPVFNPKEIAIASKLKKKKGGQKKM